MNGNIPELFLREEIRINDNLTIYIYIFLLPLSPSQYLDLDKNSFSLAF